MGYRGKLESQERARALRAAGMTMPAIAAELGVSKASVSSWTRDVPFVAGPRRPARRGPNALQRRKAAEIAALIEEGRRRIGLLSEREFLVAGAALYAGEGSKRDGDLVFTNSDPRLIAFYCAWLRTCFEIDERKLRVRLYLHEGLDLAAAIAFWSELTAIPAPQFYAAYRAKADGSIRGTKHEFGCASVRYLNTRTHRAILGLTTALLSSPSAIPG